MSQYYDLNNTGPQVQDRLDQTQENKQDIATLEGKVTAIENEIGESGQGGNTINARLDALETAVGSGGSVDERIAAAETEIIGGASSDYNTLGKVEGELEDTYRKNETYSKTELDNLITTPNVLYVTVIATNGTTDVTTLLPATGAADTVYRVGNWDGTQYDTTMYALYAWNGTAYVCLAVRSFVGEVYDISVNHPDGQGNPTPYADLAEALGTNGANIPADIRRGGMSIKFIQGTVQSSDNKYVQYRLMSDTFNTTITNWQGVDDNPTADSDNLVKSGGVAAKTDLYDNVIKTENTINLFDKTKIDNSGYVRKIDGVIQPSNDYFTTDYIPIDSLGCYAGLAVTGGAWLGYACYDSSKIYTHGDSSKQAVFQSGDAYVRFSGQDSNLDQFMVVKGTVDNYPSTYVKYGFYGVLGEDTVNENNCTFFESLSTSLNWLNPASVTPNTYIDRSNGEVKSWTPEGHTIASTGFIRVSEYGLWCKYGHIGGAAIGAAVYDKNKKFLRNNGSSHIYTYQDGDAYVRFTLYDYNINDAQVNIGQTELPYEPYTASEVVTPDDINDWYIPKSVFEKYLKLNKVVAGDIDMFLPNKVYAVEGDTLQLFYQGMAKCTNIFSYSIRTMCDNGIQYRRYFELMPKHSDIGEKTLKVLVRDNNMNILGEVSTVLKTVGLPSSPSSNVSVLCVGDSITDGGEWPGEMKRRLTGEGGTPAGNNLSNISFVGRMEKDGVNFEGNSGFAWVDYATEGRISFRFTIGSGVNVAMNNVYSNNGHQYTVVEISDNNTIRCTTLSSSNVPLPSGSLVLESGTGDASVAYTQASLISGNPFWDIQNNKLNFTKYANDYCNGSIDVLYILLGGNMLFTDQMGFVHDFIDAFHTDFPNSKVKLMGMYVPSLVLMLPGLGTSNLDVSDTYKIFCALKDQGRSYQELADSNTYNTFVEYVDIACQLDSDNNFPITEKAVNTRNSSKTEPYDNAGLHVSPESGYMQIADAAYRNFVANFCQ